MNLFDTLLKEDKIGNAYRNIALEEAFRAALIGSKSQKNSSGIRVVEIDGIFYRLEKQQKNNSIWSERVQAGANIWQISYDKWYGQVGVIIDKKLYLYDTPGNLMRYGKKYEIPPESNDEDNVYYDDDLPY